MNNKKFIIPILFFNFCLYSQENTEVKDTKLTQEVKKALNNLNSDMNKFSEEFLDGNNSFEELKHGQNNLINNIDNKLSNQKRKNNDTNNELKSEDLKISQKEEMENIITEVEIPELNQRSTNIDIKDKNIEITYEKLAKIRDNSIFKKNKKTRFIKKIPIPAKANIKKFKYKTLNDKIIIIFKKK